MKVTVSETLSMTGIIIAGIFANPVSGSIVTDMYSRQQVIQQVLNDVQQALIASGIQIKEKEDE